MAPPQRRRSAAENFKGSRREKVCAAGAGAMAGGVGVLVGQPFDMLKVRPAVRALLPRAACAVLAHPPAVLQAPAAANILERSRMCGTLHS